MDFSEKWGKTIEEAVDLAVEDLNVSKDNVEIQVLEEPSKGFLGIGSKLAKVRVTLKDKPEHIAEDFLKDIFNKMNITVNLKAIYKNDAIIINVEGKDAGIIIGKRGHTLDAFQYLTSLVVNKNREKYVRIIINAENYREKREKTLIDLANRLARKVLSTRRSIKLEPMNPYERRIIHAALQENKKIKTRSEGEDPYRHVIIELK